ncbi:MAG: DUF1579 domain-containing protein [Sphingobacteriales bacterium]|nr:MAG: DUF1579 domain-containing protein [Sphingobacteriales bacterium]
MKHLIATACFISMTAMSCSNNETKKDDAPVTDSSTATTTPSTETPSTALDSATMMKNWMAYSTPGDMHKMMAGWDGTWDCDISTWHAPETEPQLTKGKAVNKMKLGGRYQESFHTGDMMGMPFEGISVMGYDNAKKKFISTWVDNVGTGVMMLEGTWDAASKTLTSAGKCVDPSAGTDKEMSVRQILKVVDDKNHVFEMYGPGHDGKEYKMMEIKMVKK